MGHWRSVLTTVLHLQEFWNVLFTSLSLVRQPIVVRLSELHCDSDFHSLGYDRLASANFGISLHRFFVTYTYRMLGLSDLHVGIHIPISVSQFLQTCLLLFH